MSVVKCGYCGTYVKKGSAVSRSIQSFCDEDCMFKSSQKTKKKAKKKTDVSASLRSEVLAADGSKCRMCGARSGLHVHHVVYRGQKLLGLDGTHVRHNLLTLCFLCHEVVHSDKAKWQKVCLAAIWLRDVERKISMSLYSLYERLRDA